jgi:hypothetical protein
MSKKTMTDPDDRMHQFCTKCGLGRYQETSHQDDWDGVLHCTNKACKHEVKRYKSDDNPQPQPKKVKLSPTAQEVLDAALFEVNAECDARWIAVAVLRAIADQVVPDEVWVEDGERGQARFCQRKITRKKLLAIAEELNAAG